MKNKFIFILYSILLGGFVGFLVWLFLKMMNISIDFIWGYLPNKFSFPFYTIIVCLLGGLIIGLLKRKMGNYPESLDCVVSKIKKNGKYSYDKIGFVYILSFLPLIFGASVGPESGLVGVIAGFCSWIGDKFKKLYKEMEELSQVGLSVTLAIIFNAPMFGFMEPIEDDGITIPKRKKIIIYFIAIFSALGVILFLNSIFKGSSESIRFMNLTISYKEWLLMIPLCFVGILFGFIYYLFENISEIIAKRISSIVLKCTIAGLILGILGSCLPLVMFSGESQISGLMETYKEIGILSFFLIALCKVLCTNICNSFGLKGGHFFPCIFSGICLGFAFGMLLNIDLVFSICVVTTSFMAFILKKPLATILLLMICFPIDAMPIMLIAAVVGTVINKPNCLKGEV